MSDDHWEQFGPGAVGIGWDLGLVGLSVHLRTGEPLEPGQGNRWAASEEGRRVMAPASEAWGGASRSRSRVAGVSGCAVTETRTCSTGFGILRVDECDRGREEQHKRCPNTCPDRVGHE